MPLRMQEKKIGPHKYRVTQLPASRGQRVLVLLTKSALAPAAAGILTGIDVEQLKRLRGESGKFDLGRVGVELLAPIGAKLVEAIGSRLDPDTFETMAQAFAESTEVIGASGEIVKLSTIYDVHFAGEYDQLLQWFFFASEVNFGFFGRWARSAVAPAPALATT